MATRLCAFHYHNVSSKKKKTFNARADHMNWYGWTSAWLALRVSFSVLFCLLSPLWIICKAKWITTIRLPLRPFPIPTIIPIHSNGNVIEIRVESHSLDKAHPVRNSTGMHVPALSQAYIAVCLGQIIMHSNEHTNKTISKRIINRKNDQTGLHVSKRYKKHHASFGAPVNWCVRLHFVCASISEWMALDEFSHNNRLRKNMKNNQKSVLNDFSSLRISEQPVYK